MKAGAAVVGNKYLSKNGTPVRSSVESYSYKGKDTF